MPVNKKDNKKNAKQEERDSAIVPKKSEVGKKNISMGTKKTISNKRVNALSAVGKKKKLK